MVRSAGWSTENEEYAMDYYCTVQHRRNNSNSFQNFSFHHPCLNHAFQITDGELHSSYRYSDTLVDCLVSHESDIGSLAMNSGTGKKCGCCFMLPAEVAGALIAMHASALAFT